jgi:5-methylcytosine-specific restriction protein A
MARREFTRKVKQAAIERAAGKCEKCSGALKPREAEVDHILPDVLGGEPVLANAQVLCRVCHAAKSADDIRRTRKGDRQRDKASGAIRPAGKLRSAPFPKPIKIPRIDKSQFRRSQRLKCTGDCRERADKQPERIQAHPDYSDGFWGAKDGDPLFDDASPEYEAGWRAFHRVEQILEQNGARKESDGSWTVALRQQESRTS